jgi:hypothetical protein
MAAAAGRSKRHGRSKSVTDHVTKATTASFQKSDLRLSPGRPKGLMIWITMASSRKAEMALFIIIPCRH